MNASHVGLEPDELVRVLRDMRADPRFREQVIARGKSFRAAPPDAIVAFLRAAPAIEAGDEDEVDEELLRAAGYRAPTCSTKQKSRPGSRLPTPYPTPGKAGSS